MPTATEVSKLLGLFSPFLTAVDSAKLGATVAALDWSRQRPLPQRRFGITPTAATADPSRQQQLQKRLATLQPPPQPEQRLQRETASVTPSLLWSRFTDAATVVGFLEVRSGSDEFGWSRDGGEKLRWNSSEGHRLALASATAADADTAYTALLEWMKSHLAAAVFSRSLNALSESEREQAALSLGQLLGDCSRQPATTG